MQKHKLIKDIIENAIRAGIEYKEEMLDIGRGYDLSSIAELSTRQLERALENVDTGDRQLTIPVVIESSFDKAKLVKEYLQQAMNTIDSEFLK